MFRRCRSLTISINSIIKDKLYITQQIRAKSSRGLRMRDSDIEEDDDDDELEHDPGTECKVNKEKLQLFKSRGQHLLTNPRVLDAIVRKAEIKASDTVLEIGPGTGNLTVRLLEAAKNVTAIEIDKRMVEILHKRVADRGFEQRLNVINEDALKAEFPRFDLVVANIPFGISSPLIAKFLFGGNTFRNATLLIQKEFSRRLLADPGESEYNRLAANVKLVADVEFVMDVSKRDFLPVPKVDCSVVKLHPKDYAPMVFDGFDLNEWWSFTRACFSKKNKTLGATFKKKRRVMELMKLSKGRNIEPSDENECRVECGVNSGSKDDEMSLFRERVVDILRSGGCESKRPIKLSNKELLHLLSLFNQSGIHFCDQSERKSEIDAAFEACLDPK